MSPTAVGSGGYFNQILLGFTVYIFYLQQDIDNFHFLSVFAADFVFVLCCVCTYIFHVRKQSWNNSHVDEM